MFDSGPLAVRDQIVAAAARFGGTNVRVFGSVARGSATETSDVDLLIDVPAGAGLIHVEQIAETVAEVALAGRRHHQRRRTTTHGPTSSTRQSRCERRPTG